MESGIGSHRGFSEARKRIKYFMFTHAERKVCRGRDKVTDSLDKFFGSKTPKWKLTSCKDNCGWKVR